MYIVNYSNQLLSFGSFFCCMFCLSTINKVVLYASLTNFNLIFKKNFSGGGTGDGKPNYHRKQLRVGSNLGSNNYSAILAILYPRSGEVLFKKIKLTEGVISFFMFPVGLLISQRLCFLNQVSSLMKFFLSTYSCLLSSFFVICFHFFLFICMCICIYIYISLFTSLTV